MPQLDLLVSPPGTGKTAFCVDRFREEIQKSRSGIDSRSYFVLPNREHAERIQNLLLKKGVTGLFNAHVVTLGDLAARFTGGSGVPPPESVRVAVVHSLLAEEAGAGRLSYFGRVADTGGFARALSSFFAEMRRGLASVADFEKWCQPLQSTDPVFRLKFRDLSILAKRYETAIRERGFSEPEERLLQLGASPSADLVLFDGFYRFTRAQLALVAAFARGARRTVVTLTAADDAESRPDTFAHVLGTRRELEALGFQAVRPPAGVSRAAPTPGILEAPNIREEMRAVAREIRKQYRTSLLHWSDFAVILRSLEPYRRILESAFAEFDVPVHVHERRRLIEQGLAQTVVRFLRLVRDDWKEADAAFVAHSSCWHAESGAMDTALELVRAARAAGLRDGRSIWEKFAASPGLGPEPRVRLERLLEEEGRIRAAKNRSELSRRLRAWLKTLEASDDTLVRSALEDVFEHFGRGKENTAAFSPAHAVEELIDAIEAGLYSEKPRGRNRVQVYDVVMALPKEYKAVFVSGLAEKVFPKETSEEPILKDAERRVVNERAGCTVFEERSMRLAGERYFFYIASTRARERLTLTYPAAGLEGRPVLASVFIDDAQRAHPQAVLRRTAAETGEKFWEGEREAALGLAVDEFRRAGPHEISAKINDPAIRRWFAEFARTFSASRLEELAACPFRYFAANILSLKQPPEDKSALEQGNVFHDALEKFFRETPAAGEATFWSDERRALAALTPFLERAYEANPHFKRIPLYARRVMLGGMKRALARVVREEAKLRSTRAFVPAHFEWQFKHSSVLGLGGSALTGKVDRIDVSEDGRTAIVIDYKSSKTNFLKKLAKGLEFQMPIYWMAVEKILGLRVAAAEHRHLKDGKGPERIYRASERQLLGKTKGGWEDQRVHEEFEAVEKHALAAVEGLRAADIAVRSKSCLHCSYSAVCRFEPWKLIYREDA